MLQKSDIETILKINGVDVTGPDEEIRSVLLSARYNKEEVDTAIMILRENTKTHETRVEGMHKIFRSDELLKPAEISALLGIEVNIDNVQMVRNRNRGMTTGQSVLVTCIALGLALAGVFTSMYIYKVGIFHPAVSAFNHK